MSKKEATELYCEKCDYKTSKKINLDKYFLSKKHILSSKKYPKSSKCN